MAKKKRGQRPDGLIQVTLEIGVQPDGRRRRKSFYGHTRAEAEAKRDEYKRQITGASAMKANITVAEWTKYYMDTYRHNVNPEYIKRDNVPYNRLISRLGSLRMVDVTESTLQNALNEVSGMSTATIEKYAQTMKKVFRRAQHNKVIPDNPAEYLIMPPGTSGTHRTLESWEIQAILDHWHEPGFHAGLWVMIMLLSGLRRGEMMALDWSAVNMEARYISVEQVAVAPSNRAKIESRAKSAAGLRIIPICGPLYAALSSVPPNQRHGFVCLSATGKPLTTSAIRKGIISFCNGVSLIINDQSPSLLGRRMGLQARKPDWKGFSFRCHDLRHTFCTMLYDSGVDVETAAYYMGHSDIRVTMRIYTHLSQERKSKSQSILLGYLDNIDTHLLSTTILPPTPETEWTK